MYSKTLEELKKLKIWPTTY